MVVQVHALVSAVCHAFRRNRWTTDGPTTAGCFGAGRAGQLPAAEKSENVGHHLYKL